jgi:hypothetical protein
LDIPLNTETTILTLLVDNLTVGDRLKIDTMAEIVLTLNPIGGGATSNYFINYQLFEDSALVATVDIDKIVPLQGAANIIIREIPNLTWVRIATDESHVYTIRVTVTSTEPAEILDISTNTRSLNILQFDQSIA